VVVASLHLEPREAFVVPGTILPLQLWQMKHGKKFEIRLPSSIYEFEVENSTVATYDNDKSELTALNYGETTVKVTDKNCQDELEEQSQELIARIYVREPKYLSLTIFPHKNWALVLGQVYEVQVDVYDSSNQKILVKDVSLAHYCFQKLVSAILRKVIHLAIFCTFLRMFSWKQPLTRCTSVWITALPMELIISEFPFEEVQLMSLEYLRR